MRTRAAEAGRLGAGILAAALALTALMSAGLSQGGEVPWTYPVPADVLMNRQGYLTVANREQLLDRDFVPDNLVPVNLAYVDGPPMLREEAARALAALFADAARDGHVLYVKSAYRSWQTQNTMYHNRLSKLGRDDGVVAFPGASDHQTGLGVDLLNYEWTKKEGMTPAFAETPEAGWLLDHCQEYGFILRYLPEKQEITGVIHEPWHFRYVGIPAARWIMQNRLALEEFEREYRDAIRDFEAAGGDFRALVARLEAPPVPVLLEVSDEGGDFEVSLFRRDP